MLTPAPQAGEGGQDGSIKLPIKLYPIQSIVSQSDTPENLTPLSTSSVTSPTLYPSTNSEDIGLNNELPFIIYAQEGLCEVEGIEEWLPPLPLP
eukprot:TRINITY_DN6217_c0_g1_i1.p2 TRINITY_DN6217_c0_g1~~TRINITY_DN6217_c0_g1_i1.p2  ORF type:complete len:110 (+),score=4.82 TRINITY_DN6217_c0_g1_i1:49-330(+)